MAEAAALITQLRQSAQVHQDEVAAKRAEKAAMAERLSGALAIAMRAREEREELLTRLSSLLAQQTTIQTEEADLVRLTEEYRQRVDSLRAECEQREKQKADLESECDRTRMRMSEVDHAVRTARQTLNELRDGRGRHEVERARNDADREHQIVAADGRHVGDCRGEVHVPVHEQVKELVEAGQDGGYDESDVKNLIRLIGGALHGFLHKYARMNYCFSFHNHFLSP